MVVYNWHFGAALTTGLLATTLIILSLLLYGFAHRTRGWLVSA
jgi:hypothetical protein